MEGSERFGLQQYHKLKNESDLPLKLKIYFTLLENAMENRPTKYQKIFESKKGFSKALLDAFSNLSTSEKGYFLNYCLNFAIEHQDRLQKDKTKSGSIIDTDQIQNIETTCEVLFSTLKINYWSTFHFKLDKNKKMICIANKKKKISIDIRQYFVRKSKKYRSGIVMEAIVQEITNEAKKYIINFSNSIVIKIYQEILKCVLSCQQQKLMSLLEEDEEEEIQETGSVKSQGNPKALIILSSTNINQYLQEKQKILNQCLTYKFDFKTIGKSHQNQIKIQQSQKLPKIYKMQSNIENYPGNIKENFIKGLYHKNKFILSTEVLESFSKKYKAVYEKYLIHNKIQEMISIREENLSNTQEELLFMKSVQNIMNVNYLQYLYVRIRNASPAKMKLTVFICVNNTSKKVVISQDIVRNFLIELHEMLYRPDPQVANFKPIQLMKKVVSCPDEISKIQEIKEQKQEDISDDDDEFQTVKGNSQEFLEFLQGDGDQLFEQKIYAQENSCMQQQDPNKLILLNSNRPFQKMEQMVDITQIKKGKPSSNKYLLKKYKIEPQEQDELTTKILMKEHYLFKEWVRGKSGGVICTNQAKISTQKNLFKLAITKYGKNLLKGQILKISLPIQIFRKESHLESIGRNLSYAPLFLEKYANIDYEAVSVEKKIGLDAVREMVALERVKFCTLLTISVGTVGILMDKPFNPILGQTIQLWIGGCPMYVQQISHHPPIGAYLFKGRGYCLDGTIEPKMNFGMNQIKGFSPRPNFVKFYKFDKKCRNQEIQSQIEMSFGKMVIKGLLFGEREFNFEDKIYAFDHTNLIFSVIHYGPRKKHMIMKNSSEKTDYVSGHIYLVTKEFADRFVNSSPRIYPHKGDVVRELSHFQGYWNDAILFDGKEYINFRTNLPCEVFHQQDPLPSNSSYRTDLQKLIEDDLAEAQKEKDRMEEAQRRDKMLRQKMSLHF